MSQVLSKAEELANAISDCDELVDLRGAAGRLDDDETANVALRNFQEKQATLQRAAKSGLELPPEQMDELKMMQGEIQQIPSVQDFAAAQTRFNDLMNHVNNIIAAAVSGEEPGGMADGGGGCGGGCSCSH